MTMLVTDLRGAHQIDAAVKALGRARQRIEVFREIHSGRSRVKTATQIADAIGIARKRVFEEAVKLRHKGVIGEATRNGEVAYQPDNFYYIHRDRIIREAIQGRGKALPPETVRPVTATPHRSRRAARPSSRRRARSSRRRYDLFLSHASEDKRAIARPLYKALKKAGMSVWFDEETLTIGDNLRAKIDEGLARYLMAPTISDAWSLHTDGRAVIIGQGSIGRAALPRAGHGKCQLNGHRVVAVSYNLETGAWESNPDCYRLPEYLKQMNARTLWEELAGVWMGHSIADSNEVRRSAAFSKFETDALTLMIEREPLGADDVTDLEFVNLKTPDFVGHRYGPDSNEIRDTLTTLDRDLARVVAALDAKVGRDRYVVAVTADHGMPAEPAAGRQRHYADDIVALIHQKFDPQRRALVTHYEPENGQIAIDRSRLSELGLSLDSVARFLEAQPFIFAAYTAPEVARAVPHVR